MSETLPSIPDKRYFTISEVAYLCQLKPHILRYWEDEFPQLSPNKRRGNRRYYQQKDIKLIRRIRHLLYERGFTINGAVRELSVLDEQNNLSDYQNVISQTITELEDLLDSIA